ncbi:DNA-binding response regulator [Bacillus sp. HMF5848]|uniref:LytR/AlgR family response regulator transcription factor n=1 Tax=Bacillus sp. HMF5848 TaxID=2495421 RepID=UPI000F7A9DC1|nr:LytTR family DNA-binding domain-containing protein [Bacillus sp. HMF5848]RSK25657.1 DNA-binding response regulator [Bacillus sp. HMF5848]
MSLRKITAVLIDDERYSREELRHLLSNYKRIEVVGEAESGENGVMRVLQLQPDVVFLDVEMPKMNGMEVAQHLSSLKKPPIIVFATAHAMHAVAAFRYEALDYLLKPFDEDQLRETINRIERNLGVYEEKDIVQSGKLAIEGDDEIIYLRPNDILFVSRDDKLTKIVTKESVYTTRMALKDLEKRLEEFGFFRIHKSNIVNIHHVSRLIPWFNGAYQLELHGYKEQLSVSRNYVKGLRIRLEL